MYHILYYSFFGFFGVIVFLPIKKVRTLMSNLSFFRLNFSMLIQTIFWLNFGAVLGSLIAFNYTLTSFASLMTVLISSVSRASNIAAKYATFPAKQIKKYREQYITDKEIQGDFLLGNWATQGPAIIESETMNSLQRNGFDLSVFRMSFLSKISPSFDNSMEEMHRELVMSPEPKTGLLLQCSMTKDYYWGVSIFYALVQYFNKTKKTTFLKVRTIISVVFAGLSPLWAKLICGMPLTNPDSKADTSIFYTNLLPNSMLFFFTIIFFNQARIDISRTTFIMHQLSHLISTQKKSNEIIKVLPTLNFLEELSLNSWKILRRLTIDYGKKYFHRHELFLPVVFGIAMLCFLMIFALQYGVMHFPGMLGPQIYIVELQVVLAIYAVAMFYMAFDLLWAFSSINEFFEHHTLRLFTVKTTIADLSKYKTHYFKKYLKKEDKSCSILKKVLYMDSLSHIHSRLALEISQILGDKLDDQLDFFFQSSIQSVDSIIEEIAVDQKYQNITILGFVITKSFTGNLGVLLGSLTVAFGQLVLLSG